MKEAAKALLAKLEAKKAKLFVPDWQKDHITRLHVETAVPQVLNDLLPDSYDRVLFSEKSKLVMGRLVEGVRGVM